MDILTSIRDFFRQSRLLFLTCTLVPVSLGGALAYHDGSFNWLLFALTLLGVSAAHIGVNLSNDYFDFQQGADRAGTESREYSGGGGAITRDGVTPAQVKRWFWGSFALALAIGLLLVALMDRGRLLVLAMMVLGFAGGYFYTAPPLRLAYRGLGELNIFLFLGPAPVLGTYAVLTGTLTWRVFLLSMPVGGLIALLLWINEYTDYETDRAAGKRNLVVRLGRKAAVWGYLLLNVFVFAVVAYVVLRGLMSPAYLVVFLTLPLAARSVARAFRFYDDGLKIRTAQADALLLHLTAGLLCSAGAVLGTWL